MSKSANSSGVSDSQVTSPQKEDLRLSLSTSDPSETSSSNKLSLSQIQETKAKLEAQRMEYEEQGKFKKAQLIHDKLRQLALLEGNKITDQVQNNHQKMKSELVNQQTVEVDTFESVWDMKLEEYDRKAKEILLATMDRQRFEQKETEQHIRAQLMMKKPKFSKQVLQMKHILKQLIKRKQYQEAESIRNQIKPLELREMEVFQREQEASLAKKMQFIQKQHEQELGALKQRIQQGKNELLAQRRQDWNRLSQHHTNMLTEVSHKQKRILSNTKKIISTHSNVLLNSPGKCNVDYRSTFASLQPTPAKLQGSPTSMYSGDTETTASRRSSMYRS